MDSTIPQTSAVAPTLTRCSHCPVRKPRKQLLQCARCRAVMYCSVDCQRMAWKAGHRDMCRPNQDFAGPSQPARKQPKPGTDEWTLWARVKKVKMRNKWAEKWDTVLWMAASTALDLENHPSRNRTHCPVVIIRERDALSGKEPVESTFYMHTGFVRSIAALEAYSPELIITKNRQLADIARRVFCVVLLQVPADDPIAAVALGSNTNSALTPTQLATILAMREHALLNGSSTSPNADGRNRNRNSNRTPTRNPHAEEWVGLSDPAHGFFASSHIVISWHPAQRAFDPFRVVLGHQPHQSASFAQVWDEALKRTLDGEGETRQGRRQIADGADGGGDGGGDPDGDPDEDDADAQRPGGDHDGDTAALVRSALDMLGGRGADRYLAHLRALTPTAR